MVLRSARLPPTVLCLGVVLGLHHAAFASPQDFGSVAVNGATHSQLVSLSFTGLSAAPTLSLAWNQDFKFGTVSCSVATVTTCNAVINFSPSRPGIRWDAINAQDQSGHLLSTTFLHGVATAPLLVLCPGTITTLAGNGAWGYQDSSNPLSAQFRNPQGIAIDAANANLYVADSINHAIRKIVLSSGAVSTIAGNGIAGYSGDGGPASSATLNTPTGVALDAAGNIYIADQGNNVIRKITAFTQVISTVAGGGAAQGSDGFGDGGPATSASLFGPQAVTIDPSGNIYIADSFHHLIRRVDAVTNTISVVAGGGSGGGTDGLGDGAAATSALLNNPTGVTFDSASNIYIADSGNNMIRRVDANTGIITVAAGNGGYGYTGDNGPATNATLESPQGAVIDAAGNIYIADYGNNVIRQVSAQSGIITTIAGSGGSAAYSGDNGNPTLASLANPSALAIDSSGNFYIADYSNNVIRSVTFAPPSLTFPDTAVGAMSAAQDVLALNIGNTSLQIAGLNITPSFALQTTGVADCSATANLAPGASCNASIAFTPAGSGVLTGTFKITSNSLNNTANVQTVTLSGKGLAGAAPNLTLSPASLIFATQLVNTSGASQTVTLTNTGSGALSLFGIWLSGPQSGDFQITTSCPPSLAPSASCQITVSFTPSAPGTRTASIVISDSQANSPQTVSVGGAGSGGAAFFSATSLSFAAVVTLSSAPQTVTLSNNTTVPFNISSIWISGPNSSEFQLTTTCGTVLAGGTSCTNTITFSPASAGVHTATLSFADDAAGSPQTVALTGNAIVSSSGWRFVPVTPCRIADTRGATGPFGGPHLSAGVARNFSIPNSSCGIPSTALAYSLNFTAVPPGIIGFLSVWPTGQSQPTVSLLNSDGRIKANAAILPAGASGSITVYSSHPTHLIIDINGYFVPASNLSALGYFNLTPCRVVDTRASTPLVAGVGSTFSPLSSSCGVPSSAQAYSLNLTVIPRVPVRFLATWPAGQPQPVVSTLNTSSTAVTANAAIVPAGTNGEIIVYSSDTTDLIIDINGYFAPATSSSALSLFPVTPCRVIDTRFSNGGAPENGALAVNVATSSCAVASTAQAYVLNATVVPLSYLGFLSLWPNSLPQPLVSTLNASDGAITSNMAIVPTVNGSVNAYSSSATHLILDVSSYFAP